MPITTPAQYRGHILAALKSTIQAHPQLVLPLLPGLYAYARTGADQKEAMDMFLTWAWQHLRGGVFDGHQLKHLLMEAGAEGVVADVVQRGEP